MKTLIAAFAVLAFAGVSVAGDCNAGATVLLANGYGGGYHQQTVVQTFAVPVVQQRTVFVQSAGNYGYGGQNVQRFQSASFQSRGNFRQQGGFQRQQAGGGFGSGQIVREVFQGATGLLNSPAGLVGLGFLGAGAFR